VNRRFFSISNCYLPMLLAVFWAVVACAEPVLTISPENTTGIYNPGEKIVWRIKVSGDEAAPVKDAEYLLKKGGADVIGKGSLTFKDGEATLGTSINAPGTVLAEVTVRVPGEKEIVAYGGAAVTPEQIKVSSPCPGDFDAFWKRKLGELAAVPENPVLEKCDSEKPGVDYWKITMDNIRGTHIHGQIARPEGNKKLPAMLIVQWAGVDSLPKTNVTGPAGEGWIAMNILAHDLPIDESKSFYEDQSKNALNNYSSIGNDNREKCYFLRMFLSCYRAVEYLSKRPDWNGRVLVVTGVSQGGLQSFVAAGLNPKVTAVLVDVPAGCDNSGALAGREPGWPCWIARAGGNDIRKVTETSRYFDAVNFAARIKCPVLVGMGLIDLSAPPSGVFAAVNQLKGPKEIVVMPLAGHGNVNNSQGAYLERNNAWRAALLKGEAPPVKP
jgi:cephalosporin-C deacetylase-like acetyl esterase